MKAVVKAENRGFVLEADLEREISHEKIHSLVDYNFLHRRPTDLNKPSLRTMEHLLDDLGEASSSK